MYPAHITDELLVTYLAGEGDPAQSAAIASAIDASPNLRQRVEAMRQAISGIQSYHTMGPLFAVSPSQEQRLRDLVAHRPAGWLASTVDRAREIVATIVLDTIRSPLPAVGFRGAAAAGGLVRAASEGGEIDFRVSDAPARGFALVQGQVTPLSGWNTLRAVDPSTGRVTQAAIESDGYFELELPLGTYRWEVVSGDRTLIVEPFSLSPTPAEDS